MEKIKIELKWALIFFTVSLLWMLLERLLGLHGEQIENHATYTNLFAIPAIAIYVFALLDKRNNYYGGSMTYKQGFVSGLLITAFVTVLSPLAQIITTYVISPDYFPNAIEYAVETGIMERSAAEGYFNLKSYVIQGLFGSFIMGVITSAIVAIFTRKKKKAGTTETIHS